MADRRRQTLLLVQSRDWFTFEPQTATGAAVRRGAQPGGRVAELAACEACEDGWVRDRFGRRLRCEACHGAGRVSRDTYTGEKLETQRVGEDRTPFGMSWSEHFRQLLERDTRFVDCPDCQNLSNEATGMVRGDRCRRCDGTGRAAVAGSWLSDPGLVDSQLGGDAVGAMLDQLLRRDRAGSYRDLDRAVAMLEGWQRRRLLWLADQSLVRTLDTLEARLLSVSLDFVVLVMPDPIRVPAEVTAWDRERRTRKTCANGRLGDDPKAIVQRDREIRRLARDGRAAQWIASEYGLHVSTVYAIVRRTEGVAA